MRFSAPYRAPYLALVIALTVAPNALRAADEAAQAPLFASHEPLDLTLAADWRQLINDRAADPEERPATLRVGDATYAVKLKPRGKSRRRKDYCRFPPLWLDLPKSKVANGVFAVQNKLKVVTHCTRLGSTGARGVDQVWSEYLLYRVLNLLTEYSFSVRPLQVTYAARDGDGAIGEAVATHPAFVIEHKSRLAQRLGLEAFETAKVPIERLDSAHASTTSLFQYFAGNTDFSLTAGPPGDDCCHNVVPLRNTSGQVFSVAYDFDSTGFVDPPYGEPAPGLGLRQLSDRLFRGYCANREALPAAVEAFAAQRPGIDALIGDATLPISDKKRRKLERFVAAFFETLDNPRLLQRRVLSKCR
ncbi:MAG: hypothetical protein AAF515_07365 [Pseudomonadota bacterium]